MMSHVYLAIMWLRLSYTEMYPCSQTNRIRPTDCTLRGGEKPQQLADILSKIHLEYNKHVGCYLFHSDLRLTIESSGLLTSFRYHLPLLFNTSNTWIHNHLSQVRADLNRAKWQALHHIPHSFAHSKNTDTSSSTAMLPMQPPSLWPRMHIWKLSVRLEARRIQSSVQFDVSISTFWWMAVDEPYNVQQVPTQS